MKRHMETIWEHKGEIKKGKGELIKLHLLNHYSYHIDLAKFGYILHMKVGKKNPSTFLAT